MAQALYRKWRPRLWEQVVGQEHVVQTLRNAVRSGRVAHAYLFAGPRGTGKTTIARLLAKALNCLDPDPGNRPCDQCATCRAVNEGRFLDLIEIDAASNTSVDDVRDLRDKINLAPGEGRYKVYIIDEVHMLSTAAFNALLKTLEEPPPHAVFILATTEVHKIPPTVLSRCQRFEFRRIPLPQVVAHLKALAQQEGVEAEEDALLAIARQATGSLRDAISLFDQLAAGGDRITLALVQAVLGTAADQRVVELVDAILHRQPAAGLDCIHRALDSGVDARQFARQVVDYLRNLLLVQLGSADQIEATAEQRTQMAQQAHAFALPHLLETVRLFNQAASETRAAWQPALLLELALAQAIHFNDEQTPSRAVEAPPTTVPSVAPRVAPVRSSSMPVPGATPAPQAGALRTHAVNSSAAASSGGEATVSRPETSASEGTPPAIPPSPGDDSSATFGEGSPAPEVDTQKVMQNWARIRALVKSRRTQTEALLNSAKVVQVREGALCLGFATQVLKSKMENPENIALTRSALKQVLGVDLPVVCVVVGTKATTLPEDLGLDANSMVATALNLGAKIVKREPNPNADQE